MNAFIDDCLHVIPSGKQCPFKKYFNGAVVLETIDFSVSDLRKDDPIQHGLLQVTVMTAPLAANSLQTVVRETSATICRSDRVHAAKFGVLHRGFERGEQMLSQFVGCRLQNKNQLQ